jgi:hypothetical protein
MMPRVVLVAALSALAGAAYAADGRGSGPIYSPQPIVTGDVELGLGRFFPALGPDTGVFTGTARANMPIQGSLNVELQTSGNALYLNGASQQWLDVYGHVWQRLPSAAWGLFGGTEFIGSMINAVGAEGKMYLGNVSVGGEAARLWTQSAAAWEVAGNANVYLNPNLRIGAGGQFVTGFGSDLWTWSIDAELRMPGTPWSIWAYGSSLAVSGTTSYVALGGFKWFLDAPNSTLQSHEKDVPFWFKSLPPLF